MQTKPVTEAQGRGPNIDVDPPKVIEGLDGGPGTARASPIIVPHVPRLQEGSAVKMLITVDLRNRHQSDSRLLESCVRDGVKVFNDHTGDGASIKLVRLCNDELYEDLLPARIKIAPKH
jgi:hypothetical protein